MSCTITFTWLSREACSVERLSLRLTCSPVHLQDSVLSGVPVLADCCDFEACHSTRGPC